MLQNWITVCVPLLECLGQSQKWSDKISIGRRDVQLEYFDNNYPGDGHHASDHLLNICLVLLDINEQSHSEQAGQSGLRSPPPWPLVVDGAAPHHTSRSLFNDESLFLWRVDLFDGAYYAPETRASCSNVTVGCGQVVN
jgi:hypothetical protein